MNPVVAMKGAEMLNRYKFVILVVVTIVIFILVIYFWGKRTGKTESTTTDLPKDTDWGKNNLTAEESSKIQSLAVRIHNELKGLTLIANNDLWDELLYSTDRVFVGTYNYFNQKYEAEGKGTLYDWLEDEYSVNLYIYKSTFSSYKDAVIRRMNELDLM